MTDLVDRFQRRVNYLRMSVTDRCDFRCVYCMPEDASFLPRSQVLTLEELLEIGTAFTELGVTKIRVTGGEPLVRANVMWLLERLGRLPGLQELVLTTNGSQLARRAGELVAAGVARINVSLDTLRPERFRALTRNGDLSRVLAGLDAAKSAGFRRVKLNAVVLKHRNDDETHDLVAYAVARGFDISFIEEMPLGELPGRDRAVAFCSSESIRQSLAERFTLLPSLETTGGPSRYWRVKDTDTRVGFISPHSHNFCASCNRVRLTAPGRLLLCLGQEHSADLRAVLRTHPGDRDRLKSTIVAAMAIKPAGHEFELGARPVVLRHMNATGG